MNFNDSFKEAVAQIRDLGGDFSEDGVCISGWNKPLMRHALNHVFHHYPAQVTKTKWMVYYDFAQVKTETTSHQPGKNVLDEFVAHCF